MDNFDGLIGRLLARHVEFVVIGGYAAVTHGAIDVTRDLDICCPFTEPNLLKLQDALAPTNPVHRITIHPSPLALLPGHCERWRNLY
ncbi:MAG TPA: hypothetical protein VF614_05710, partial [Chthoniobacteraceae bacterium]